MRILVLIPAAISLVLGLSIGLVRLGYGVPLPDYDLLIAHGTLMVCGFFGTLICLERSAVLQHPLAYAVPILCGLGVLVQLAVPAHGSGAIFFVLAAVGLAFLYAGLPGARDTGFFVQLAGAIAWIIGTAGLYFALPNFVLIPWWMTFLVLTIAGERLELSRFRQPSRLAVGCFIVLGASYFLASVATLLTFIVDVTAEIRSTEFGDRFASEWWEVSQSTMGLSAVGMSLWLVRYDLARSALKRPGLSRFTAVCLLVGYVWLAVSGVTTLLAPTVIGGPWHDSRLHAVFLGFVLSMVFGHALIIGPGVFGVALKFHRSFYVALITLHASVALRYVSDLRADFVGRNQSGVVTVVSVGLFMLCIAFSRWLGWRTECQQKPA